MRFANPSSFFSRKKKVSKATATATDEEATQPANTTLKENDDVAVFPATSLLTDKQSSASNDNTNNVDDLFDEKGDVKDMSKLIASYPPASDYKEETNFKMAGLDDALNSDDDNSVGAGGDGCMMDVKIQQVPHDPTPTTANINGANPRNIKYNDKEPQTSPTKSRSRCVRGEVRDGPPSSPVSLASLDGDMAPKPEDQSMLAPMWDKVDELMDGKLESTANAVHIQANPREPFEDEEDDEDEEDIEDVDGPLLGPMWDQVDELMEGQLESRANNAVAAVSPTIAVTKRVPSGSSGKQTLRTSDYKVFDNKSKYIMKQFKRLTKLKLDIDTYQKHTFQSIAKKLMKHGDNSQIRKLEVHRMKGFKGANSDGKTVIAASVADDYTSATDNGQTTRRTIDEMKWFFKIIRDLPCLEELHIYNIGTNLMNDRAAELQIIGKYLLKGHPTLTKLKLNIAAFGSIPDKLLESVTTIKTLKHVELDMKSSCSLAILVNGCPHLESLVINPLHPFRYHNEHLLHVMQSLDSNKSLKTLDLGKGGMISTTFCAKVLAYSLRENKALEVLKFSYCIDGINTNDEVSLTASKSIESSSKILGELCVALYLNQTLQVLHNYTHGRVSIAGKSENILLTALEYSSTIKEFTFFEENEEFSAKKVKMIETKPPCNLVDDEALEAGGCFSCFVVE